MQNCKKFFWVSLPKQLFVHSIVSNLEWLLHFLFCPKCGIVPSQQTIFQKIGFYWLQQLLAVIISLCLCDIFALLRHQLPILSLLGYCRLT
jgi:hypothetical protein